MSKEPSAVQGLITSLAVSFGTEVAKTLADRLINGSKKEQETVSSAITKVLKGNALRRHERALNKARAEAAIARAKNGRAKD